VPKALEAVRSALLQGIVDIQVSLLS